MVCGHAGNGRFLIAFSALLHRSLLPWHAGSRLEVAFPGLRLSPARGTGALGPSLVEDGGGGKGRAAEGCPEAGAPGRAVSGAGKQSCWRDGQRAGTRGTMHRPGDGSPSHVVRGRAPTPEKPRVRR